MQKWNGRIRAGAVAAATLGAGLVMSTAGFRSVESSAAPFAAAEEAERLATGASCACGCGSHLPGGPHGPVCFGCSVGKADLAFIRESLAAGTTSREIELRLNDPMLLEIFADYDDDRLPALWARAQRVADELRHHRLVLRTRARSAGARRAVALAECARLAGSFKSMQRALIRYNGPWDEDSLLHLAAREGLRITSTRSCLATVDVQPQIEKDRQHAAQRNVADRPTLFVNRKLIEGSDAALRRAIESATRANSI